MSPQLTPSALGIGPHDQQPPAPGPDAPSTALRAGDRERWIREAWAVAQAGELIQAVEAGVLGKGMRRAWRRYRSVAVKNWPFNGGRKAKVKHETNNQD